MTRDERSRLFSCSVLFCSVFLGKLVFVFLFCKSKVFHVLFCVLFQKYFACSVLFYVLQNRQTLLFRTRMFCILSSLVMTHKVISSWRHCDVIVTSMWPYRAPNFMKFFIRIIKSVLFIKLNFSQCRNWWNMQWRHLNDVNKWYCIQCTIKSISTAIGFISIQSKMKLYALLFFAVKILGFEDYDDSR